MIVSNLNVLMAERGLKISEVSKRTGISRTTLTSLAYNRAKGIQLETLDNLCDFFNIDASKLLIRYNFIYNLILTEEDLSDENYEKFIFGKPHLARIFKSTLSVNLKNKDLFYEFPLLVEFNQSDKVLRVEFPYDLTFDSDFLDDIPTIFKTKFINDISEDIRENLIAKNYLFLSKDFNIENVPIKISFLS